MFGETALVPLAYVLAGTVADRIGSGPVMWICCLGILAVTVALLPVPGIRRLGQPTESKGATHLKQRVTRA